MTTTRKGPALALVATCAGCEHHKSTSGDGRASHWCEHPEVRLSAIGVGYRPTPSWCPLLPAARLAFARAVVKEGEA